MTKDPLEELRDCVRYGNTPGENVLLAWEKERAEYAKLTKHLSELQDKYINQITILEKRVWECPNCGTKYTFPIAYKPALDAALGGGV